MKAYLDLHLVTIIENKNMNDFECVANGKLDYQSCVNMLIQEEINKEVEVDKS
jgi:hypothetical protein